MLKAAHTEWLRCRLRLFGLRGTRFSSSYLRLADRAHRHLYNSMQTEMKRYRNGKPVKLKPYLPHFFVWLQKVENAELVVLGNAHLPNPFTREAVVEVGLFHLLVGLKGSSAKSWDWESQKKYLDALQNHVKKNLDFESLDDPLLSHTVDTLLRDYQVDGMPEVQKSLVTQAVSIIGSAAPEIHQDSHLTIIPWLKCLFASSVSESYRHIEQANSIPPSIYSDILLRTPISRKELHLQLSVWRTFTTEIGRYYDLRTSHLTTIMSNLSYYSVHHDHTCLYDLTKHNLQHFTATNPNRKYALFKPSQVNKLLWTLTSILMHTFLPSSQTSMSVIRSQELLVKHITHAKLSQLGFMAVVISLRLVSEEKAQKLLKHAKHQYPDPSVEVYLANIYLSTTPEELLHNFNVAMSRYETSAALWLAFITKINEFSLLTEHRSLKILDQLLERSKRLIISKQIILLLLQPVKTVHAIEEFIGKLQKANMLLQYLGIVHSKYLQILYQNSEGKSLRKPYLNQFSRSSSNIECARLLYANIERKTVSNIGVMLAGESSHQAENLYDLYKHELNTTSPDENCLVALLRAASKKYSDDHRLWWNNHHASQIAVYEFKINVSDAFDDSKIMPSNKTWQLYIGLLKDCDYTAELSEIMRWWEQLHFVPEKDTLMKLLRALPAPFAQRHVRHWRSVPDSASSLHDWPWPTEEELIDQL